MNENSFVEEYNAIMFECALIFSILSHSMGLVSLNNLLDKEKYNQRDIFEYGMRLITGGRTAELIDKILTNIINLETDKERKLIKKYTKRYRHINTARHFSGRNYVDNEFVCKY
jgi:hypothetical protein